MEIIDAVSMIKEIIVKGMMIFLDNSLSYVLTIKILEIVPKRTESKRVVKAILLEISPEEYRLAIEAVTDVVDTKPPIAEA